MPARGYSSTAPTPRNRLRRPPVAPPGEHAADNAARRSNAATRQRSEERLRQQVATERAKVRTGHGLRADSGDVTRATKAPAPAERRRAAAVARPRKRGGVVGGLLSALHEAGRLPGELADFVTDNAVLAPVGDVSQYGVAKKRRRGGGGLPIALAQPVKLKDTPVKNLPADAINLPKNSVIGMYDVGAAGVEASHGDTKRARRLLAGLDDGAVGRLVVHGDVKGAAKAFEAHPLYSALEVTGTGQIVGRGAGAVARSGAVGRRAARAAGTKRAPLRIEGTNQQRERRYSPNVMVKGLQVAAERDKRRRGLDPTVARGQQRSRMLNAEVDEFAAQAEGTRRRGREETAREAARIAPVRSGSATGGRGARTSAGVDRARSRAAETSALPGVRGRAERHVVLAAVEGRLRGPKTFRVDVTRERDRLQRVYDEDRARPKPDRQLSASARRANREQVRALDRVLRDPKAIANAHEVFRAADEYNRAAGPLERGLIRSGALDAEQADAARLRPYAVTQLGARYDPVARLTDAGEARRAASAEVRTRQSGLASARRETSAALAGARVSAARRKSSPGVKAAEAELRGATTAVGQLRRRSTSQARVAGRAEGKAQLRVAQADRARLRTDKEYRKRENALRAATQEKAKARRVLAAAQRSGKGYSPEDVAAIRARVKAATERSRGAYQAVRARERELLTDETTKRAMGTRPAGAVARVERRRAAELETTQATVRARERSAAAERRVAAERRRVRGVEPGKADRLRRALAARDDARTALTRAKEAEARVHEEHRGRRDTAPGLRDAEGRRMSTADVRAQLQARGDREPGFVGQRRADRGASSFFVNWFGGRKTVDSKSRTGEASRTGAYDASFTALEEHLVRSRGVLDAISTFDDFVGRMGARRQDGSPYTYDESLRAADELADATGMAWLPVRAVPARYDAATKAQILESQGTAAMPQHLESLTLGRLDDALKEPAPADRGARNVVLVPAQQVQRFAAHQTSGSSTGAKLGQAGTRAFRNTVLPFSTKWLFGNVAEATLRAAVHGITPVDVVRGARIMRSLRGLDENAWKAADTRIRGGLLYGSADRLSVHRGPEDFEGTLLEGPAKGAALVARLPVIRQTIGGLDVYKRAVFAANRGMERAFQSGVIGKQARLDAQELTGSWVKALTMQQDVAREVARGLLGTPKQVQFARAADEVLGKYSRFSPGTRRVIQSYAPFLPWFLNAARFVGHTLPARHPAKTALLANVELTLQDDIDAHRKTVPPGDLESAIRRKDGGLVNLARYTPFGAFTKGPAGLADPLLPQIDSAVAALRGQSFTGRPLQFADKTKPDTASGRKLWLALYTLAEGAVPGVQIARRIREKGATPFDDSTVFSPKTKPGTARTGAADRILNPLRPTYLSASGGGPPATAAQKQEARQLQTEAKREQPALEREARAILREAELLHRQQP